MSNEILDWSVIDYKSTVEALLQQRGSKFRGAVMEDSYHGKSGAAVNQIGAVNAQARTTRHADTPLIETPHDKRWVFPTDYEWADLIDDQDKLRVIADPTSPYAINGAMALGRSMDDLIIAAATGTAKTGEDGTTSTAHGAGQTAATTSGGLTVAKLREAMQLLIAAEVDVDNEPLYCAIGAQQHDDLLGETQAVSLDYTNRPVLVDGRIKAFMGFNFIDSQRLALSGTDRTVIAWAKSGLHLGIWNDINARITERDDKSYSTQVYVKGTFGATRIEEEKVVAITCSEA
ncbi:phage capsid protein [bacterium]|nr:phage capsid protein [bacterium]